MCHRRQLQPADKIKGTISMAFCSFDMKKKRALSIWNSMPSLLMRRIRGCL